MSMKEKVKFQLNENFVLIEPIEEDNRTNSGLIVHEDNEELVTMRGKVLAVGPGMKIIQTGQLLPMTIKVDDDVIFPRFSSQRFIFKDKEYVIIKEHDIFGTYTLTNKKEN